MILKINILKGVNTRTNCLKQTCGKKKIMKQTSVKNEVIDMYQSRKLYKAIFNLDFIEPHPEH